MDLSHMLTEGPSGPPFTGLLEQQLELFEPNPPPYDPEKFRALMKEIFGEHHDLLRDLPFVEAPTRHEYVPIPLPTIQWGPPLLDLPIGDE